MTYGRRKCDPVNGCGSFYKQAATECPKCGASDAFSDIVPFNPLDWVYDLETYPNVFTASFKHPNSGARAFFEVSPRVNQLVDLIAFLYALRDAGCRMVGFNNNGFDYPIIHFILENHFQGLTVDDCYGKASVIIATPWDDRFNNVVWDKDQHIQQIDLSKVHHFDNSARLTSLKMLEFNMRSQNIEDLPFEPGFPLQLEEIPVLNKYNDHDVDETEKFYIESIEMIEFREELGARYGKNFLNHSDKKIGTELFVMELEKNNPGCCYSTGPGRRTPNQTIRPTIRIADAIFPYIQFKRPEFQRVKDWLMAQNITETKGIFSGLCAEIEGFKYDFGLGGIHGSIDSTVVHSDDDFVIYDWDVAGYYPSLGAVNNLFPEHLSSQFGVVDAMLKAERAKHAKGSPLNTAIKLARNGAYGDSNNKYSPFYDPLYTMSITINGQLLLCILAEHLIDIPNLQMIQVNTDGLTVRCPRIYVDHMKAVCKWWEDFTKLELESAVYSRMFIRDVNNYIAEYDGGGVKRKGAYEYNQGWHQNHSQLIVARAAEAALVHGTDIETFIRNHDDIFDFMLRTKVGRADQLVISDTAGNERQLQKITRYYVALDGGVMTKISPPAKGVAVGTWKRATKLTDHFYDSVVEELKAWDHSHVPPQDLDTNGLPWDERINTKNRSKYEIRRTGINTGWLVAPCNDIRDAVRSNINFDYYIAEARKLVDPLTKESK